MSLGAVMDHRVARPEIPVLPSPDDLMQIMSRPAPVIAHPAWRDARDKILSLVEARCHLIAILGPAGSGKTTLLRDVGETLQRVRPVIAFSEFSDVSCEFPPDGVVLVDEAERLSRASCDMLAGKAHITVVLAALPSFYGRFMEFREGTVVPLPLLTDEEATAFLGEWMAHFGLPLDCLAPDSWERLITHCHGVPRLLASLLKLALFVGADECSPRVLLEHVEMAIAVQGGGAETNLAEIAGFSSKEDGRNESVVPALPQNTLDIPPLETVASVYRGGLADGSAAADASEEGRKPARRRIAPWIAAGALFIAAIAVLLWWDRQGPLSERIWLARHRPIEASSSPVAAPAPPPSKSATTAATLPAEGAAGGQSAAVIQSPLTPAANSSSETKTTPASAPAATATSPVPPALPPPATMPVAPAKPTIAAPAGQTSGASSPVPAVSPPAATGITLPSAASIRVVVTYAWGDEAALQRSLNVSRILREAGFTVLDPFPVSPKSAKKGIRYYFVQDEGVADTIVNRLGGDYGAATLAQFSVIQGLPRPGTIEVDVGHE